MKRTILVAALMAMLMPWAAFGQTAGRDLAEAKEHFDDSRFGVFIHWGIYSMMARGEWVMQVENLDYQEYARLAGGFYPSRFDAAEWARIFKEAGAKYVTFTSRHHDGFSMFKSDASSYNVVDATPFGRDVVGELAKALGENGIDFHLYYSHLDWGRTDYWPRGRTGHGTGRPDGKEGDWQHYLQFLNAQLTELLTNYGPIGAIWFDGVWDMDERPRENQPEIWNLKEQYNLIHRLQPGCLVGNNHHLLPFEGEDMQIFERDIPGCNEYGLSGQEISRLPLETCQTMNGSWGYRLNDKDYKSTDELIEYLVRTAAKGANLLLNVGPRPDGTIPEEAVERLRGIGKWLEVHGESIYGTDAGPVAEQEWGVSTVNGNVLYLHILGDAASVEITLPGASKLMSATLLANGEKVTFTRKKDVITVQVPQSVDGPDKVVRLEFKNSL